MQFFTAILLAVSLVLPTTLAAPRPLRAVQRFSGETSGKYIVKFKSGASRKNFIQKHGLKNKVAEWDLLNGFAGNFDDAVLDELRLDEDVEYIAEDGIMHTMATVTQTNAPWGLQRISQDAKLSSTSTTALTYTYKYDSTAGAGVDIYVVDTGIYTAHSDFGGRARWGASFNNLGNSDGNGHGTHCAGTAGGTRYGVAKAANLIAVKVLSDSGSGATSGIVSGLNWVLTQARASGRPSVVSMSLGGSASTALDNAVTSLTAAGVHVVVAAGNSNTNAANTSPARAPSAITVGASTIGDVRSSFSNYGAVVDIFAPGTGITSTWIGSTTATNNISGTSMATPHVAGLVAYLIAKDGNVSPAAMATKLQSLAVKGVLTSIPSGTVNSLANNS
ncbi:Alkaline serine protease [Psilocybe cubensis]|uniref:Alkaline serine protease n=2 Tax=Psilocybe cubensis TaxID=181762 RepID=A0ACB8HD42_PSICU|nr:Alkaline serine protease [Psilocybe cubensis]KAH9485655.1 Alkaline serine protease [Psilocybe cubensis]